jgi:phage tail-like protein
MSSMGRSLRSVPSGYYTVVIEGEELGIVQSVEGGGAKADLLVQQVGGDSNRTKSIGNLTYDPITMQIGASMAKPFYQWIANSWDRKHERRDGSILKYDYNIVPTHEIEFKQALVTETTVPALDGTAKQTMYLTVKLQPEKVTNIKAPTGARIMGLVKAEQKAFMTQNFRFELDTIDVGRVTKIESFTVKQNVKPLQVGTFREAQMEPTSLEFPNITFTTSLDGADALIDWHKKYVIDGNSTADDETTGHITLLDPSMQNELLEIELDGVGMTSLRINKSEATSRNSIDRVVVELFVTKFAFKWQ